MTLAVAACHDNKGYSEGTNHALAARKVAYRCEDSDSSERTKAELRCAVTRAAAGGWKRSPVLKSLHKLQCLLHEPAGPFGTSGQGPVDSGGAVDP